MRMTYIDNSFGRILQIGGDGEIDEVIDAETFFTKFVNTLFPRERALVPVLLQYRPSAQFF